MKHVSLWKVFTSDNELRGSWSKHDNSDHGWDNLTGLPNVRASGVTVRAMRVMRVMRATVLTWNVLNAGTTDQITVQIYSDIDIVQLFEK